MNIIHVCMEQLVGDDMVSEFNCWNEPFVFQTVPWNHIYKNKQNSLSELR